ncbi:MAG TPA: proline dehydrogenase family protein [Candidatus Binatia bacterium]|nr:proline dehydrogenase family protein [Candidatus Binatia bacterium]
MLSAALRALFLWLSNRRWVARVALATPLLRRMPLRFVAGTTLDEAVAAVRALNAAGATATLDVLGESVDDRASADRAAAVYVEAIERIASEALEANVSIKLTQMGLELGVDECLAVLVPVVEAGTRHGIFIRIDMESSDTTDRTLDVVARLRADGHDVGPAIQSYLHRSVADVETLAADRVRTRVCKGAYAEPPEIAHQERDAIGDAFVRLCERLLEADAYPGVATHDAEMIRRVSALARERGIGPDRFEFQMLYGVRRDLQRRLIAEGYRLRVYVPYGTEWYPYFMRRLAERPANVLFVLRSVFGERS